MSLANRRLARTEIAALGVLLVVFVALGALFAAFFARLPVEGTTLAMDWKGLWACLRSGIHYDGISLRNPPWSIFYLYPLARLPMQAAWGVAMYLTVVVLVVSVPQARPRWRTWLGVLFLTASFPSLRHMADGNFEGVMIGGLLLALYGYWRAHVPALAAGLLLSTAKPQEVLLLLPVLGVYMLMTLPRRALAQTAAIGLLFVIPGLVWRGEEWWTVGMMVMPDRGSDMDISLMAALDRLGLGAPLLKAALIGAIGGLALTVAWASRPHLSRELAGMLVAASLLIAPYSAGNSVLVVLAIGIIPLFQRHIAPGLALIALYNVPFALNNADYRHLYAYYHTGLMLVSMMALGWSALLQRKRRVETAGGARPVPRTAPAQGSQTAG
jgi:hypothetical protein